MHHYDEIGLLAPAQRTFSGHRLYGEAEVARLYRIVALRRIGMALEDIGELLDGDAGGDLGAAMREHAAQLDAEIRERSDLRDRLTAIADELERQRSPSLDDYLQAIERTTTMEQHFTKQQMDTLAQRREQLGDQAIKEVEDEWPRLFGEMRPKSTPGRSPRTPNRSGSPRGCAS